MHWDISVKNPTEEPNERGRGLMEYPINVLEPYTFKWVLEGFLFIKNTERLEKTNKSFLGGG